MNTTPANWSLDIGHASKSQFAKFQKNHPKEFTSLFANLEKIMGLLRAGNKVGGFHVRFFRSEGGEVYRIGQTGVPGALESRLYVYPDTELKIMHVLEIGGKTGQQADIRSARKKVIEIQKQATEAAKQKPSG
ncbi:hypothetical protein OpiT1DRAFT_03954 [Opitutaceae bacterium TAV1]|nr:hypothetical protein OpiT1DRAFT_03954 [Opitutaceae bacterium TAV1]